MDILEGWLLEIGGSSDPIIGLYGDIMSIQLDLGLATSFTSYNQTAKTLSIEPGSLNEGDVGKYDITVNAHFTNKTYSEYFSTNFTLTVRNDNPIVFESEVVSTIEEWKQERNIIKESLQLGEVKDG